MITVEASTHPWRCIAEDGTRCPQLRVTHYGTVWTCKIYHDQDERWPSLQERDGCLVRDERCVAAECKP